jgi:secondary thiamine-phosphate synthase enzyme
MWKQTLLRLNVPTTGRGLYEITRSVAAAVREAAIETGLVTVFVRHTSASLLIQENADPDVRGDLERFFSRLAPDGDPLYVHTLEGEDDMPAHVRSALTAVNLSIPIDNTRMTLGTWQGIYLWEHRHEENRREVTVHILGETDSASSKPSLY